MRLVGSGTPAVAEELCRGAFRRLQLMPPTLNVHNLRHSGYKEHVLDFDSENNRTCSMSKICADSANKCGGAQGPEL